MVLSRKLDDKEIQLKNQSLIFFQISGAGHEAMLAAAGMVAEARATTGSIPYYRDRALCLDARHDAARDAPRRRRREGRSELAAAGRCRRTGDTSALNIVSQSSPTGTQCLHAVGCAEAGRLYERVTAIAGRERSFHADEVIYVSIGDGTTSEGEFWESLNSACTRKLPGRLSSSRTTATRSRCRSKCRRRAATSPSSSSRFPGLFVRACDGTDFLGELRGDAATPSRYARARKGPALVHAKVIRPYSHSLSDDEKLYKTTDERAAEATRDPITQLATFLVAGGARDRRRSRGDRRAKSSARSNAAADAALKAREARRATPRRSTSTRPTSIRRRRRSRRRPRPRASPTRWSRPSTAR